MIATADFLCTLANMRTTVPFVINILVPGFFLISVGGAGALPVEGGGTQRPLIAQGIRAYCAKCGTPLDASGKCPYHDYSQAETGKSSSSGGGGWSLPRRHLINYPSMPQAIPTPFQLQRQHLRKQAVDINEAALQAAQNGSWDEAINLFQQALDVYPDYDEGRTQLRDNVEWAQRQRIGKVRQQEERRVALQSTRELVNRLQQHVTQGYPWNLDVPGKSPHGQLPEVPTAITTQLPVKAPAEKALPRHLPLPTEIEQLSDAVLAAENSKKLSDNQQQEFKQIKQEFEASWLPLSKAYQEYMDANAEIEELTKRINAHNAESPGEGAALQQYDDDARMLLYQMAKVKPLLEAKRVAFMGARETLEPKIDAFLASGKLDEFSKRLNAAQTMPPRLPVADPSKIAGKVVVDYRSAPTEPNNPQSWDELYASMLKASNKHNIEDLECPALRGKQGVERDASLRKMNDDYIAMQTRVAKDLNIDLENSERLRREEVTSKVDALRKAGAFANSADLDEKLNNGHMFLTSALAMIGQEADENDNARKDFLRGIYQKRIAYEERKIMGYEH